METVGHFCFARPLTRLHLGHENKSRGEQCDTSSYSHSHFHIFLTFKITIRFKIDHY
jgi:hypothetical protein